MTQIEIEQNGAVLLAKITNPPQGFADPETEMELAALLDRVDADEDIRSVVFTGGMPVSSFAITTSAFWRDRRKDVGTWHAIRWVAQRAGNRLITFVSAA